MPLKIDKKIAIDTKMARWEWILLRVIADHGHTISLMEAALIAESMPEKYDYDKWCKENEQAYMDSILYTEKGR